MSKGKLGPRTHVIRAFYYGATLHHDRVITRVECVECGKALHVDCKDAAGELITAPQHRPLRRLPDFLLEDCPGNIDRLRKEAEYHREQWQWRMKKIEEAKA